MLKIFGLAYLKKRGDLFDYITAYITHLSQGLLWCKQYKIIKTITERYFSNEKVNTGYHAIDEWNDLKIYYSVALFNDGKKDQALFLLNQVEPFRFHPSTKYYHNKRLLEGYCKY